MLPFLPRISLVFAIAASVVAPTLPAARAAGLEWPILDSPKHWLVDNDGFHLSLDSTYAMTDANYDGNSGALTVPAALVDASVWSTRFHGALALGPRFSLFAQGSFRQVNDVAREHVSATTGATVPATNLTSTGLGDAFAAVRWTFHANRMPGGRFASAREIASGNFRSVLEGGVTLNPYSLTRPPRGNRSLDFGGMWRLSWWIGSPLALSAGVGYMRRGGIYADEIPYSARADYYFAGRGMIRAWADLRGWEGLSAKGTSTVLFPSGSLLYGSAKSRHMLGEIGLAKMLGQDFELALAGGRSLQGKSTAQLTAFSVGLAYRPAPEGTSAFFNPKRDLEIGGLARHDAFDGYHWSTPIIQVSKKGNFFKIARGTADGVTMDDEFHVFVPRELAPDGVKRERLIARASVVALRGDSAFLKLDPGFRSVRISPQHEARRVKRKDPLAPRKIYR